MKQPPGTIFGLPFWFMLIATLISVGTGAVFGDWLGSAAVLGLLWLGGHIWLGAWKRSAGR